MRAAHPALLLLIALGCTACATGSLSAGGSTPPDPSTPARFEPTNPALRLQPADTLAGSGCLSPMLDPRDGARIVMLRSSNGVADYAVAEGQYGVRRGHLLRLECNTGRVVGIVRS